MYSSFHRNTILLQKTGKQVVVAMLLLHVFYAAPGQLKPPPNQKKYSTSQVWFASHLLPGSGQILNRQYWKIPVFYAGMGSMVYLAVDANRSYLDNKKLYHALDELDPNKELLNIRYIEKRQSRNQFIAAAGAIYTASIVDALLVYHKGEHSPAAATIFSTLVPGLGQAYNQKYWKIPVVWGGLSTFYFMVDWNNRGYQRYKTALLYKTDGDPDTIDEFQGMRTEAELRLFKDAYRRNRDLSFLGFALVYVLNIIDANVDANLYDWDVSDDLTFRVEPSVVNINFASSNVTPSAIGMTCKLTF